MGKTLQVCVWGSGFCAFALWVFGDCDSSAWFSGVGFMEVRLSVNFGLFMKFIGVVWAYVYGSWFCGLQR